MSIDVFKNMLHSLLSPLYSADVVHFLYSIKMLCVTRLWHKVIFSQQDACFGSQIRTFSCWRCWEVILVGRALTQRGFVKQTWSRVVRSCFNPGVRQLVIKQNFQQTASLRQPSNRPIYFGSSSSRKYNDHVFRTMKVGHLYQECSWCEVCHSCV